MNSNTPSTPTTLHRSTARSLALCLLAGVLGALSIQPARAVNGTPSYLDFDGTTAGFGTAANTSDATAVWSTSSAGTATPTTWVATSQVTVGAAASDLSGAAFTLSFTTSASVRGIVVNSVPATVTLAGSGNANFSAAGMTVTVAAGSELIWNSTRSNSGNVGFNMSNRDVLFNGGGTNSFITHMGCNDSALLTLNGPTINLKYTVSQGSTPSVPFSGGFTLTSGALNFGTANSADAFSLFGVGKAFSINGGTIDNTSGAAMTLTVGGAGYSLGGNFTFVGSSDLNFGTAPVVLTGNRQVTVSTNTLTMGGAVSGSGFGLTKVGNGTLRLNGTNSYSGATTVSGGKLVFGAGGLFPASAGSVTVNGGTTLDVSAAGPATLAAAQTLSVSNAILVVGFPTATDAITTPTLDVAGTTNQVDVTSLPPNSSYPIQIPAINYTSLTGTPNFGLGNLPFSPGTPYAGYISNNTTNTSIDVVITNGPVPPRTLTWNGTPDGNWDTTTSNWLYTNTASIYNPGDLVIFDDTATGTTAVNLTGTMNPASMTVSNVTQNYGFGGAGYLSGSTGITKTGAGTLYLTNSGVNDYTGVLTILGGTVQVGDGASSGNLGSGPVANGGALVFNRADAVTMASPISGSGTVTKQGAGTLTLSATNTYAGATTVLAGTLITGDNAALGTTNGATTINGGATLDVNARNLGAEPVNVSGTGDGGNGAIVNNGAAQILALRYVTLLGNTTFGGSGRWDIRSPTTSDATLSGLSTGGNPHKLTKIGANQISFVGTTVDSALGDVEVQQGILSLETAMTGLGNSASNLTVASGATLQLFQLTNQLNKVIAFTNDGATASLNNASGANTIVGPITLANDCIFTVGGTSLRLNGILSGGQLTTTSTGFGNLILGGNSTHAGTTVGTGKLTLNGKHAGPINCAGAFLPAFAGSGTNFGSTTLGGPVFPGETNIAATITVSNLTLESTATLFLDLGPTTTVGLGSNDLIQVNGDLTVNGNAITINPQGLLLTGAGNPYRIINYTGNLIWNADLTATGPNNYTFTVDTNTPGQINLVAAGGPPVWNGGSAVSDFWSDATNWSVITIQPSDVLFFSGSTRLNNTNDTADATTYNGLTFNTGAGQFILNGNFVTLAGPVVNNSATTQTVRLPLSIGGNTSLNGGTGTSKLALTGDVTNTATAVLTLAGNGSFSGSITNVGGRTTFLTASNSDWTLLNNTASAAVTLPSQLNIHEGGAFTFGSVSSAPDWTLQGTDGTGAERNGVGNGANTSVMNMVNGSLTLHTRLTIGNGTAGGILNMSGGTLTTSNVMQIADNNMSTVGTLNLSGGTLNVVAGIFVTSRGTGTINQSGGVIDTTFAELARNLGGQTPHGTINLNGGLLRVTRIQSSSTVAGSTANLNFNGGTLQAKTNDTTFLFDTTTTPLVATIKAGGAVIDSGGFAITNPIALLHDATLGATPDGGLTKIGNGTLTLTATNTYTGSTTVTGGRLVIAQPTLATNSTVSVATNAVLELGFAQTNTVAALVLDGVNKAPGVYNATTDATYLAGTGSLLVPSSVNLNPTNITTVVGGGAMTLSWPASHTGWTLQVQTNTRSVGLGTNWFNVTGSSATNQVTVPVSLANPTVFYRLVYP